MNVACRCLWWWLLKLLALPFPSICKYTLLPARLAFSITVFSKLTTKGGWLMPDATAAGMWTVCSCVQDGKFQVVATEMAGGPWKESGLGCSSEGRGAMSWWKSCVLSGLMLWSLFTGGNTRVSLCSSMAGFWGGRSLLLVLPAILIQTLITAFLSPVSVISKAVLIFN